MRSSWICVDASFIIRLVMEPGNTAVQEAWRQLAGNGIPIAAPSLLYYEVTNGLYRYLAPGLVTAEGLRLALQTALALPIQIEGGANLHQAAIDMAARFSLPAAYDAHYLALSESLSAAFWTADRRLVRAVEAALPWVHLAGQV